MGTGIDTSTAPASAHGPGGPLVRRATLRVSVPPRRERPLQGIGRWLRREARRLLADDPQITAIRRAVGWASLAGAAVGVVLAFVLPSAAPEPVDTGRPTVGWHARRAMGLARRPAFARQPVRDQPPASALQPRPAPAPVPVPAGFDDARAAAAPARTTPTALAQTPPNDNPSPRREAPVSADAPADPSTDRVRPGTVNQTVGQPAAPMIAVDERARGTSSPAASVTPPPARGETRTAKGRRREGPAAATLPPPNAAGAHGTEADELVWLAERAFQTGHSAEAVRLGQKALAAGGGARAQLTIAGAYFDMRDFDHARGAYEAVLAAEPGNQAARAGLEISRGAMARSVARAP